MADVDNPFECCDECSQMSYHNETTFCMSFVVDRTTKKCYLYSDQYEDQSTMGQAWDYDLWRYPVRSRPSPTLLTPRSRAVPVRSPLHRRRRGFRAFKAQGHHSVRLSRRRSR